MYCHSFFIALAAMLLFHSCTPKPYATTNKMYNSKAAGFAKVIMAQPTITSTADSLKLPAYWVGTTNFGMRKPNMVIIHHTAQNSCEQTLQTFTLERSEVSAHYVICKDGTLHHMLNDYLRAWHAGSAKWGSNTDINSSSVGIEIDNNGVDTFSRAQINTLLGLLLTLKKSYNIPSSNFIGHGDVAPARKNDPNATFPWKALADSGYGLWYADTSGLLLPPNTNDTLLLGIIGYDMSKPAAAIQAFRRHFLSVDAPGDINLQERKILYMLSRKYY